MGRVGATNDMRQQPERQSTTGKERLTESARNNGAAFRASAVRQHIPE